MNASSTLVAAAGSERIFSFRRGLRRPSRCVSPKLLAGVIGAMLAGPVAAEPVERPAVAAPRAIFVELAAPVPFDAGELTAALRVRLPAVGAPVQVRVTPVAGGVRIEAERGARELALGDASGAAAARLVALAAQDLLLDDLAAAPEPRLRPPPAATTIGADGPERGGRTVGVLGAVAAWDAPLGSLSIDVVLPRGRWLAAIDAGGGALVGGSLSLAAATVRGSGGVRVGWLELRGGVTLAPVIVRDGAGDRTVLAGAGGSVRARLPLGRGVRAVLAGGADVFATRTSYLRNGTLAMATPRWAPWLAAGVEVSP